MAPTALGTTLVAFSIATYVLGLLWLARILIRRRRRAHSYMPCPSNGLGDAESASLLGDARARRENRATYFRGGATQKDGQDNVEAGTGQNDDRAAEPRPVGRIIGVEKEEKSPRGEGKKPCEDDVASDFIGFPGSIAPASSLHWRFAVNSEDEVADANLERSNKRWSLERGNLEQTERSLRKVTSRTAHVEAAEIEGKLPDSPVDPFEEVIIKDFANLDWVGAQPGPSNFIGASGADSLPYRYKTSSFEGTPDNLVNIIAERIPKPLWSRVRDELCDYIPTSHITEVSSQVNHWSCYTGSPQTQHEKGHPESQLDPGVEGRDTIWNVLPELDVVSQTVPRRLNLEDFIRHHATGEWADECDSRPTLSKPHDKENWQPSPGIESTPFNEPGDVFRFPTEDADRANDTREFIRRDCLQADLLGEASYSNFQTKDPCRGVDSPVLMPTLSSPRPYELLEISEIALYPYRDITQDQEAERMIKEIERADKEREDTERQYIKAKDGQLKWAEREAEALEIAQRGVHIQDQDRPQIFAALKKNTSYGPGVCEPMEEEDMHQPHVDSRTLAASSRPAALKLQTARPGATQIPIHIYDMPVGCSWSHFAAAENAGALEKADRPTAVLVEELGDEDSGPFRLEGVPKTRLGHSNTRRTLRHNSIDSVEASDTESLSSPDSNGPGYGNNRIKWGVPFPAKPCATKEGGLEKKENRDEFFDFNSSEPPGIDPWVIEIGPNPVMFPHLRDDFTVNGDMSPEAAYSNFTAAIMPNCFAAAAAGDVYINNDPTFQDKTGLETNSLAPTAPAGTILRTSSEDRHTDLPQRAASSPGSTSISDSLDGSQQAMSTSSVTSPSANSQVSEQPEVHISCKMIGQLATTETKDSPNQRACAKCNIVFPSENDFIEHIQRRRCRRHNCGSCPARFALKADLGRHLRTVHRVTQRDLKAFVCSNPKCSVPNKQFLRKDNFERHIRRCIGEVMPG